MAIKYYKNQGDPSNNEDILFQAEGPVTVPNGRVRRDDRATMELTMSNPTWQNHFHQNTDWRGNALTYPGAYHSTYYGDEYGPGVGEQGALFSRQPGVINNAMSAPSMTKHLPTMLGIAANEHTRLWRDKDPQLPRHSASLSEHSSRLVKTLKGKGVDIPSPGANPNADVTNNMGWDHTEHQEHSVTVSEDEGWEQIPQADVRAGFQTTKAVLRGQQFQRKV